MWVYNRVRDFKKGEPSAPRSPPNEMVKLAKLSKYTSFTGEGERCEFSMRSKRMMPL